MLNLTFLPRFVFGAIPQGPQPTIIVNDETLPISQAVVPSVINGATSLVPAVVIGASTIPVGETATIGDIAIVSGLSFAIVGGGSTFFAPTPVPSALILDGKTFTADSQGSFIREGPTLAPGQTITMGTGPSATMAALTTNIAGEVAVVVNDQTSVLGSVTAGQTLVLGGQIFTADSSGGFAVSGQTLAEINQSSLKQLLLL